MQAHSQTDRDGEADRDHPYINGGQRGHQIVPGAA
jgi:hypothetical protein